MHRVLRVGGHAVWRSAAKYPWYRQRFELARFKVEPIDIRENGQAIDRVNMYASCEVTAMFRADDSLARREDGLSLSPKAPYPLCLPGAHVQRQTEMHTRLYSARSFQRRSAARA